LFIMAPATSMTPRSSPTGHAARVADPALRAALTDWLRPKAPRQDIEDLVQGVLAQLLVYPDPPASPEALQSLARRMLLNDVIDLFRSRGRRRRVVIGEQDERIDDTVAKADRRDAWDRVDVGKRNALIDALVAKDEVSAEDIELLERTATEGYAGAAAELGVTEEALRKRVQRKRGILRKRWIGYAGAGVILLVLGALVWREPEPVTAPAPVASVEPPLDRARTLREHAAQYCQDKRWRDCLGRLDDAKRLDPAGDADPHVQSLRAMATAGEAANHAKKDAEP
jgi:DNA-directed RNA polymerase specialized sigma24 family protein